MIAPPKRLDDANVLLWSISPVGRFHTILDGEREIVVAAMAICQYEGDDRFYLFKCDSDWNVIFDWDAFSMEEAKEIAASHVKEQEIEWQ
jgi:hypothetical protein